MTLNYRFAFYTSSPGWIFIDKHFKRVNAFGAKASRSLNYVVSLAEIISEAKEVTIYAHSSDFKLSFVKTVPIDAIVSGSTIPIYYDNTGNVYADVDASNINLHYSGFTGLYLDVYFK